MQSVSRGGREGEPPLDSRPVCCESNLLIKSWSELAAHLATPGRGESYRSMLREFGVDPDAEVIAGHDGRPAILFVEQPGCWLTPRDLVRVRLLERLMDRGNFDPVRSGVRALVHDRFTWEGDKAVFLRFDLHPGLGPARLLGSMYLRRYKHRTYASLHVQAKSYLRMRAIWDYSLRMLEAADISAERFAEVTGEIFSSSPEVGGRDILPSTNRPNDLLKLGHELRECRLEPAFKGLWPARSRLTKDMLWDVYWNAVNGEFLEAPIGSISPLLGRILTAVTDPVRMGRRLHAVVGAAADEPVSVAGYIPGGDIFRMVLFDPVAERFFVEEAKGETRVVDWEEVRLSAAEGRGGRPSGVLEYLFLAAVGCYFVVEPYDRLQPFQESACAIHQESTGIKYPWVTFSTEGSLGPEDQNHFTDVFRPGFAEQTVNVLSGFLDR